MFEFWRFETQSVHADDLLADLTQSLAAG